MPSAETLLEKLVPPLREVPARTGILSDIDGTLAPIVDRPEDAAVPDATRAALEALVGAYGLVACVSGRRAEEARRMVGVEGLLYAGNHGYEILFPGETEATPDPALGDRAGAAREFVAHHAPELTGGGLRVEDKGPIQALHWRGVLDIEHAHAKALSIAADAEAAGLEPRWGRKVLELRPYAGIHKGSVVSWLLRERGLDRALFGGDDITDLDAFRALRDLQGSGAIEYGLCVGVDSDEAPPDLAERSDVVVDGTEGFADVLRRLAG
jgi:trehalose 6-phosphate phosphatase